MARCGSGTTAQKLLLPFNTRAPTSAEQPSKVDETTLRSLAIARSAPPRPPVAAVKAHDSKVTSSLSSTSATPAPPHVWRTGGSQEGESGRGLARERTSNHHYPFFQTSVGAAGIARRKLDAGKGNVGCSFDVEVPVAGSVVARPHQGRVRRRERRVVGGGDQQVRGSKRRPVVGTPSIDPGLTVSVVRVVIVVVVVVAG